MANLLRVLLPPRYMHHIDANRGCCFYFPIPFFFFSFLLSSERFEGEGKITESLVCFLRSNASSQTIKKVLVPPSLEGQTGKLGFDMPKENFNQKAFVITFIVHVFFLTPTYPLPPSTTTLAPISACPNHNSPGFASINTAG